MTQVTPVILCGGSGKRFWKLTTSGHHKQLISHNGNNSIHVAGTGIVNYEEQLTYRIQTELDEFLTSI